MDADSSGAVMRRIGTIEDSLSMIESDYYGAAGQVVRLEEALKVARAQLTAKAEGSNAEERKAWVETKIHESPDYTKWVEEKAVKAEKSTQFEVLSKRLSACQSVLKRHEQAMAGPGAGRGQQNS